MTHHSRTTGQLAQAKWCIGALVCSQIVIVQCDERGDIDMADLKLKAEEHSKNLSALMVTYPSTHGVFEQTIKDICQLIHDHGGQV